EASVYRLPKARDLIASPAFIVMKAADEFSDKTTAPNQLWQTDFTYLLHRPRLLPDNGSSYISDDLAKWLQRHDMPTSAELRTNPPPGPGSPVPSPRRKHKRGHKAKKNGILRDNYPAPGDLEAKSEAFGADYDPRRYHKSIDNLTPADVYFGRGQTILLQRERIKRQTIARRRLQHQRQAA